MTARHVVPNGGMLNLAAGVGQAKH